MTRRLALAAATALFLSLFAAAPAVADPKGEVIELECDGSTFSVSVNGNGEFTPAHDDASTKIFIPVWFEFTGVLTDADGNVLDEFTDTTTKGSGRNADIECTFDFSDTFEDPDLGPITVTGTGTVRGFHTPRR